MSGRHDEFVVRSTAPSSEQPLGHAATVALLLPDWQRYGLAERVCYHFALSNALHLQNNNDDDEIPDVRRFDVAGTNHYGILMKPHPARDQAIREFLKEM